MRSPLVAPNIIYLIQWLLRIGVFATFLGHGLVAFSQNISWLPYLDTVGINGQIALYVMKVIGVLDIVIAFSVLIHPWKPVLYWCVFWTLATAMIRPLSGESLLSFVERAANWTVPLVLLILINNTKLAGDRSGNTSEKGIPEPEALNVP